MNMIDTLSIRHYSIVKYFIISSLFATSIISISFIFYLPNLRLYIGYPIQFIMNSTLLIIIFKYLHKKKQDMSNIGKFILIIWFIYINFHLLFGLRGNSIELRNLFFTSWGIISLLLSGLLLLDYNFIIITKLAHFVHHKILPFGIIYITSVVIIRIMLGYNPFIYNTMCDFLVLSLISGLFGLYSQNTSFLKRAVIAIILLIVYGFLTDERHAIANAIIYFFAILITLINLKKNKIKNTKFINLITFTFFVIAILFVFNLLTKENEIGKYVSGKIEALIYNREIIADTRSFAYSEVLDQLNISESIVGRGILGRYYSDYVNQEYNIAGGRYLVEIGILWLILKIGYLGAVLYLILNIFIIKTAYNSRNSFTKGIGFVIICRLILMSTEQIPIHDLRNIMFWILCGIVLSENIREISDEEIIHSLRTN